MRGFPQNIYGLKRPVPILVKPDDEAFWIECDSKYYLWSAISNDVWRIKEPKDLKNWCGRLTSLKEKS